MRNTNRLAMAFVAIHSTACAQDSRLESIENKVHEMDARILAREQSTHAWVLWQYSANDLAQGVWQNPQWEVFQSAERLAQCEERLGQAVARLTKVLKDAKKRPGAELSRHKSNFDFRSGSGFIGTM